MRSPTISPDLRKRLIVLLSILLLALIVRGLTARFMSDHLSDTGWFPYGIFAIFDRHAQNILDGKASILRIDDPTETDAAIYPPGYPLWIAVVYAIRGVRSAAVVQNVQWVLDSFAVLIVVGLAVTAFGWRAGVWAGILAALSPLLALYGAMPLADAPTGWIVLGGTWMLVLAAKRKSWRWAIGAGAMVGLSCWLRGNAMFLPIWWTLAVLFFTRGMRRERLLLAAGVALGAALLIAPVVIRNLLTFRMFVPTGLGAGTNLWEGIGETDRAAEFGAVYGDGVLTEKERTEMGVPAGEKFTLYYPDGPQRDRARAGKAMAVIRAHPLWYAGVMLKRMAGVLKFAGEPSPIYGSAGVNVTSKKSLPQNLQGGVLAIFVTALGMIQSVLRYLALPLMLIGIAFGLKQDARMTGIILSTVLYYLVVGSILHMEIRYGLPMQAALFVFAGLAVSRMLGLRVRRSAVR